jgi:hypothetical protein
MRLCQIVKVEGPITFEQIRHWRPDVPMADLVHQLSELEQAHTFTCSREWSDFKDGQALRLTLTYEYNS